jgi:hypothetical protein
MQDMGTKGVRLKDLKQNSCRYAYGGPWDRAVFFCGAPTAAGCSWCKEHRKRVYAKLVVQSKKAQTAAKDDKTPLGVGSERGSM